MDIQIHIQTVQHLHIGGGGECFPAASSGSSGAPAGRIPQLTQTPGRPPFELLRRAVSKPCATCQGTGEIVRNTPDFPGEFESAACPVCSRERRAG